MRPAGCDIRRWNVFRFPFRFLAEHPVSDPSHEAEGMGENGLTKWIALVILSQLEKESTVSVSHRVYYFCFYFSGSPSMP